MMNKKKSKLIEIIKKYISSGSLETCKCISLELPKNDRDNFFLHADEVSNTHVCIFIFMF